jgi:hypothetical protein
VNYGCVNRNVSDVINIKKSHSFLARNVTSYLKSALNLICTGSITEASHSFSNIKK